VAAINAVKSEGNSVVVLSPVDTYDNPKAVGGTASFGREVDGREQKALADNDQS